jgi:hypothetical protein
VSLRGYFSVVVGGDKVVSGKPDPALYLRAAELLAAAPAQCLAFEDSENGVKAAVAAGIEVVLVPDVKAPTTQMRRDAFIELASLKDAIPLLQAWFGRKPATGPSADSPFVYVPRACGRVTSEARERVLSDPSVSASQPSRVSPPRYFPL